MFKCFFQGGSVQRNLPCTEAGVRVRVLRVVPHGQVPSQQRKAPQDQEANRGEANLSEQRHAQGRFQICLFLSSEAGETFVHIPLEVKFYFALGKQGLIFISSPQTTETAMIVPYAVIFCPCLSFLWSLLQDLCIYSSCISGSRPPFVRNQFQMVRVVSLVF